MSKNFTKEIILAGGGCLVMVGISGYCAWSMKSPLMLLSGGLICLIVGLSYYSQYKIITDKNLKLYTAICVSASGHAAARTMSKIFLPVGSGEFMLEVDNSPNEPFNAFITRGNKAPLQIGATYELYVDEKNGLLEEGKGVIKHIIRKT